MSRGTIVVRDIVARDLIARDIDIWWYWVNIGQCWLVFGGTGSVWGSTGWYLAILGQYNLALFGIKWYWVYKMLLCLYILKKINGDVNQPTDRPTNRPGEYRAICLFWKLEDRKRAEICNLKISTTGQCHTGNFFEIKRSMCRGTRNLKHIAKWKNEYFEKNQIVLLVAK